MVRLFDIMMAGREGFVMLRADKGRGMRSYHQGRQEGGRGGQGFTRRERMELSFQPIYIHYKGAKDKTGQTTKHARTACRRPAACPGAPADANPRRPTSSSVRVNVATVVRACMCMCVCLFRFVYMCVTNVHIRHVCGRSSSACVSAARLMAGHQEERGHLSENQSTTSARHGAVSTTNQHTTKY